MLSVSCGPVCPMSSKTLLSFLCHVARLLYKLQKIKIERCWDFHRTEIFLTLLMGKFYIEVLYSLLGVKTIWNIRLNCEFTSAPFAFILEGLQSGNACRCWYILQLFLFVSSYPLCFINPNMRWPWYNLLKRQTKHFGELRLKLRGINQAIFFNALACSTILKPRTVE